MSIDRLQLKLRTIMGRFQLPKLLPLGMLTSALASKVNTSPVTKIFHFKEDFFLKFYPLPHAIGPDNVNVLMSALKDYAPRFKDVWIQEIEANLQGGSCKVEVRGLYLSHCFMLLECDHFLINQSIYMIKLRLPKCFFHFCVLQRACCFLSFLFVTGGTQTDMMSKSSQHLGSPTSTLIAL